jgi:hypothetical protein
MDVEKLEDESMAFIHNDDVMCFHMTHPQTLWKIHMRIQKWKQWKELGYVL